MKRPARMMVNGLLALGTMAVAVGAWAGDKSHMEATVAKWEAAYNAGDLHAVAEMYTADGCRMPPNEATANGRAAILQQLEASQAAGPKVKLGLTRAESGDHLGYATGTYEILAADGTQLDHGKWMNVSKNVGGEEWPIHCDIWNSNKPLPAQ